MSTKKSPDPNSLSFPLPLSSWILLGRAGVLQRGAVFGGTVLALPPMTYTGDFDLIKEM